MLDSHKPGTVKRIQTYPESQAANTPTSSQMVTFPFPGRANASLSLGTWIRWLRITPPNHPAHIRPHQRCHQAAISSWCLCRTWTRDASMVNEDFHKSASLFPMLNHLLAMIDHCYKISIISHSWYFLISHQKPVLPTTVKHLLSGRLTILIRTTTNFYANHF